MVLFWVYVLWTKKVYVRETNHRASQAFNHRAIFTFFYCTNDKSKTHIHNQFLFQIQFQKEKQNTNLFFLWQNWTLCVGTIWKRFDLCQLSLTESSTPPLLLRDDGRGRFKPCKDFRGDEVGSTMCSWDSRLLPAGTRSPEDDDLVFISSLPGLTRASESFSWSTDTNWV